MWINHIRQLIRSAIWPPRSTCQQLAWLIAVGIIALIVARYLIKNAPLLAWWGIAAAVALVLLVVGGYVFRWRWIGVGPSTETTTTTKGTEITKTVKEIKGKTLWDWLQLLIIPAVLAGAALLFNYQNAQTQQDLSTDNQREAALQAYFDTMSQLMLDKQLRTSQPPDEIRKVARIRTLSTLGRLDGQRKGLLLQFLHESQLITTTQPIVLLTDAHLWDAPLSGADLSGDDLSGADLSRADLSDAHLKGADLSRAHLEGADLEGADLEGADLEGADLEGAHLEGAKLNNVIYTKDTIWPPGFTPPPSKPPSKP